MASSPTHPFPGSGVAAAMARHPAGRLRAPGAPKFMTTEPGVDPLAFAAAVALLTGPWRVGDPEGFASAMTGAATIAGHAVADAADLDDALVAAVGSAAARALDVRWVAGTHNGDLYVEARGCARSDAGGPGVFVVAHVVENVSGGSSAALTDHSWLVLLVGDGAGGVSSVVRATLGCPGSGRCCPRPDPRVRIPLAALREQLLRPALAAEVGPPAREGVVLAFRR